jgi:iron complex outermembrane receptor protein
MEDPRVGPGSNSLNRLHLLTSLVTGVTVMIAPLGFAANDTPAADALAQVVVTAQRRVERLQDVPISAQVVNGQTLADHNLTSLETLSQTVPAMQIVPGGPSNELYIRGIGSGGNESFDQSVGTFIDDIYHGRSRSTAATFLDLDRIEILKGPQTTFFGNNAIAGALNVVTKKPGNSFDAWARALYGEFGQYALEGAVGGPITDTLGARLALTDNGVLNGWIDNANLGRHEPEIHDVAGRLTLGFNPTRMLEATLKIEGGKDRNTGGSFGAFSIVNCPPPPPLPTSSLCSQALSQNLPLGLGSNRTFHSAGQGSELSNFESVLTINYDRGNHTFTSVSGFHSYHFNENFDADGLPATLLNTQIPEKYHQFSQEFRAASRTDGAIEYLTGAYFQTDQLVWSLPVGLFLVSPTVSAIQSLTPLIPYSPLGDNTIYSQSEHNYSVFGLVSWNPTDRLKLSAGLRGSWVKKDYTRTFFYGTATEDYGGIVPLPTADLQSLASFLGAPPRALSGSRSDNAWMPSTRAQYKINPRAMVYFSYTKGFLAGGFNATDPTGDAANLPFSPEYVQAYEAGLKSEWLDRRLLLNLSLFRSDYNNLQVAAWLKLPNLPNLVGVVRNAASSRSQGAEFEGQWVASNNFHISASVSFLNAYYVSYPNAGGTQLQQSAGQISQDLSGRPTLYSPPWSGSVIGNYSVRLPGGYEFTTELSPYFSSGYYNIYSDEGMFYQKHYVRLDSRLALGSSGGRWSVDLIGKNLTNRNILTVFGNPNLAAKQQPRSIAVQFRYH